jgi:hypothetical protein
MQSNWDVYYVDVLIVLIHNYLMGEQGGMLKIKQIIFRVSPRIS